MVPAIALKEKKSSKKKKNQTPNSVHVKHAQYFDNPSLPQLSFRGK